jgi:hypothetical protein
MFLFNSFKYGSYIKFTRIYKKKHTILGWMTFFQHFLSQPAGSLNTFGLIGEVSNE